ncbi:MAG TPA: hypothetical protein PLU16_14710 [Gallionellaceae bacterium]|nr:hypothetical protein [Gallionellaceae bacterium]HQS76456.1 hypothetical protein [Gallionellaceae bacterium]
MEVLTAIEKCFPTSDSSLELSIRIEDENESDEPKTISVSGVWGPRESAIIKSLCNLLAARFYDAESCEFIEL